MASLADTTVLVTGATGYVGSHVVKVLLARGYSVRGTVRSTSNKKKIAHLQKLIDDGERFELIEADLLQSDVWPTAISGCTYVCHVASPFVFGVSEADEDTLIKPAVDGTLNVLKPSKVDPGVKKAVVVSSVVAIMAGWEKPCEGYIEEPEKRWSVPERCDSYSKSKTLAEMAAWDLVNKSESPGSLELAVVNPGFIIGPTLSANFGTSLDVCTQILNPRMPMTPRVCVDVVDVRDVAEGIVRAMEKPEATGERFVLCGAAVWFNDLAQACRAVFVPLGYNPPFYNVPNIVLRTMSWFVPSLRVVARGVGQFYEFDNTKAKTVLGMDFKRYQDSFVDMCHSLIQHGLVDKTPKYTAWEIAKADGNAQDGQPTR